MLIKQISRIIAVLHMKYNFKNITVLHHNYKDNISYTLLCRFATAEDCDPRLREYVLFRHGASLLRTGVKLRILHLPDRALG